jgi:ABC-type enterochelin transport system substrate-binding protein
MRIFNLPQAGFGAKGKRWSPRIGVSKGDGGDVRVKKRSAKTKTTSASKKTVRPAAGKAGVRDGSKKAIVLELLRRNDAKFRLLMEQLVQPHSMEELRSFLDQYKRDSRYK